MLNTHKLLYICQTFSPMLSNKLYTGKNLIILFVLSAFRQINGEYLNDNEFIADIVNQNRFKVEEGEYTSILPGFSVY